VTAPSQIPAVLLAGQRVLVCDGAMGTMLHAAGAALDRSLPELNLTDPGLVSTIHESYLSAGADIIQTNTFGANRLWLGDHGVGDKVAEINRAGVRIARAAQDRCERDVLVAGSVSPAVTGLQRRRTGSAERAEVLREQIEALLGAGLHRGDRRDDPLLGLRRVCGLECLGFPLVPRFPRYLESLSHQ
jgi:homocysteine S-methyltransferase